MGDTLNAKQLRAIDALITGATREAAAQAAGVSTRQVHRWLSENVTFQRALRDAEAQALARVVRRLARMADAACNVLESAMAGGADARQVRAADIVLSRLLNWKELVELDRRVTALEERHAQNPNLEA